jgi:hypothetical protein
VAGDCDGLHEPSDHQTAGANSTWEASGMTVTGSSVQALGPPVARRPWPRQRAARAVAPSNEAFKTAR